MRLNRLISNDAFHGFLGKWALVGNGVITRW
jgi:hypothetical protein